MRTTRGASWYYKPGGAYGCAILQYTNTPTHQRDSCAQAAVATLLSRFNLVPPGLSGDAVTESVYATHPPDVRGDNGGTTANRLTNSARWAVCPALDGNTLHTVEFNTSDPQHSSESNGGAVALKERQLHHVLGYIKTY